MAFHYTTSVKKPDGIFHVRLYSFDANYKFSSPAPHAGMPQHMAYLQSFPETPFPATLIPSGGIGKLSEAYADQFFRATPEFQNMGLTLAAHPIFSELITEISVGAEVWLEIAIEQYAEDIPEAPAFAMFYPRKKRLYFWGKLLPQETKGHVKFQELNSASLADRSNFIGYQSARDHYGTITLSFMHWFKVTASQDPRAFLDSFRASSATVHHATKRWGEFLEAMVAWMQPTYFHAASDHRLLCKGNQPDNPNDPSRFNFLLSVFFSGSSGYNYGTLVQSGTIIAGVNDLRHIGFAVTNSTGAFWSLFDNPLTVGGPHNGQPTGQRSSYSFYNFKTLGDLFLAFCEECQLKCQVELPTLEEAYLTPRIPNGLPDNTSTRQQHWEKCSRWLFFDAHTDILQSGGVAAKFPKPIYFRALEDKIDYMPRPSWLGKLDVMDASNATFEFGVNESNYGHHNTWGASADGAIDVTVKTIFCFVDCTTIAGGDDPRGAEVILFDDLGGSAFARSEQFFLGHDGFEVQTGSYAYFVGWQTSQFWNNGTAVIELDYEGIGIEPFGATADTAPGGIKDYRLNDFGEFRMFRTFSANPGILLAAHTATDFRIFSSDVTLGEKTIGETHIKAVIKGLNTFQVPDVPPPPDIPATPPVINPPSFAEPVCGWVNFTFGVNYSDDVCSVSATIDGVPTPAILGGNSGNITPVFVSFAACVMALGVHVICVTVIPCDTRVPPVTQCWSFTVNHNCC